MTIVSNIILIFVLMYTKELQYADNELPAKINTETGEVVTIDIKPKKKPDGMSKLNYENFGIINIDMLKILRQELTKTEISIVVSMIMRAQFNTNSLAPLSNDTSIREIADVFDISPTIVSKTFKKLMELGVYAQLNIVTDEGSEFWILNPYIYWQGRYKLDSLFAHFAKTKIVKLMHISKIE